MKPLIILFAAAALAAIPLTAQENNPADPLSDKLFPPELILHSYAEINLTDDQRESIVSAMRQSEQPFIRRHNQLEEEKKRLAKLLSAEKVDTAEALEAMDKMLEVEGEIKRTQLSLLLKLKNLLTASQQTKLTAIKKNGPHNPPLQSLQKKMEALQEGVQEWQSSGKDPSPIAELMQPLDTLMKEARFREAEALLEKGLKLLEEAK